jgi:phosphatidylserine synthase
LAYFQGMPIPMASILLITGSFWQHWTINIWWTIVVVTVSYLMVSPFAYPKVKHLTDYPPIMWAGVCAIALMFLFFGGWKAVPFGMLLLYAVSGPIFSLWFATGGRRIAR